MKSFFTIIQLKELFINSLNKVYSKEEVLSIFYILLSHKLNLTKTDLILQSNTLFNASSILEDLQRLMKCEPVQYIIQTTTFLDLNFKVSPAVLIPRQETEELVYKIIQDHKTISDNIRVLDIGTGSGVIAISLAKQLLNSTVYASDFSLAALQIATHNAATNQVAVQTIHHDILLDYSEILPQDLDIIVSNPPYIPESSSTQMHANVLDYEPKSALFVSDDDPLVFYKRIAKIAKFHLKNKGKLYFETFETFHPQLVEYLSNLGYSNVLSILDMNSKPRFIVAENFVSLP